MNRELKRGDYILIAIIMACCAIGYYIWYNYYGYAPPPVVGLIIVFLFFCSIGMWFTSTKYYEIRLKGIYSIVLAPIFWFISSWVFVEAEPGTPEMAVSFAFVNISIYNTIIVVNGIFLLFAKKWAVRFYKWLFTLYLPVFIALAAEESYIKNTYHIKICVLLNIFLVLTGVLFFRLKRKIARRGHE